MIKKLQRKITVVLMTIFAILLCGVLVTINVINYTKSMEKIEAYMEKILNQDGEEHFNFKGDNIHLNNKANNQEEALFRLSQFYLVDTDLVGNITKITNTNVGGYTNNDIEKYTYEILTDTKSKGRIGHLLYRVNDGDSGKSIVFIDNSLIDENITNILKYSVIFGSIGLIVLFFISLILSKWIVKPVKESFQRQKQFISDASHELKTPLTVIGANADILESEIGENKWLNYIQSEVVLMSSLVNKLLTLAKLESAQVQSILNEVNLSKVVLGAAMPFESVAFEKGINLNYRIEDNLTILGNEDELKQVVGILVDNAIKHTESKGNILISLEKARNKTTLKVMNKGKEIALEDRQKIFERFYRVDQSRTRNSKRYGLGLAIGKAIVEKHKGTVKVECVDGWTKFIVSL